MDDIPPTLQTGKGTGRIRSRNSSAEEEMWRIKFDNAYKHCAAYGTSQYGANRRYYRRHRTSGNN